MGSKVSKKVLLLIYALLIIIPMVSVFLVSFKTASEMYEDPLGLPEKFSFSNYKDIFKNESMGVYIKNSVIVTVFSVSLTLFFASMIAFSLSRIKGYKGMIIFALFTLGMMVPAQVNMVPLYSLIFDLGLTNSLIGLIIVNIASTIPVAVFILTGFMKTLPSHLFEAAIIDGAGNWKMYTKIAIPLSLPSLSATAIFLFVMHWNDLLYPLLFITDKSYKTLPLALLEFQGQYMTNYPMLFTGVIIASAPMIIIYIFLQRYFIEGMTAGSVKG